MSHVHQEGGPTCRFATKKSCDEFFADWQAMQSVLLAYRIAVKGEVKRYKGDKSVLAQLVRLIAGEQEAILNGDGNPSQSAEVKRLMAAIERAKNGELPGYNLYELTTISAQGGTDAVHQRTTGVEPRVD